MPATGSGVMFGPYQVPYDVVIAYPPAYGAPPGAVWQAAQPASPARTAPFEGSGVEASAATAAIAISGPSP